MPMQALEAARDMLPLITRHRGETESARRIAEPVVDSLRKAGFGRLAIPREMHGLELPTPDALQVYEMLAGTEASVGWIVWNNTLPCFWGRFLQPAARAEIFGNPDWLYASSTRPSGKAAVEGGGYRVTGRWSLVSGCELSEWMALRCMVEENGQPRMLQPNIPEARLIFLRRADVEILDTWHTGGLRGTGSHDVVVTGKFVTRAHTCSPMDGSTVDGAIGRVPIVCNMAAGYGAQLLGLGRAAIDALMELTRNKPAVDPGPGLGERPAVLAAIAEHQARIAAAREFLHSRVTQLWNEAEAGQRPVDSIAAVYAAAHHAMAQGRAAVTAMYALAGASSLYTSSPLERSHRDMFAMAAHVIAQPMWLEDTGRIALGLKTLNPLYLV
jgi:alkylation response protein AidB-like acyl-CoA dehydrogenase